MDIPSQFEERVLQMLEYSYGATRVIVTLEGGREISDYLHRLGTLNRKSWNH